MNFFRNLPIVFAIIACLVGCDNQEAVHCLVAASTVEAVEEVVTASGMEVRVVSAGSNQLASQILAGAPADVFLSADTRWADALGALRKESTPLLSNQLCIIMKKGNEIRSLADLDSVPILAMADEAVPAGRYAVEALTNAGVHPGRVVHGRNVRNALAWVAQGEANAGVVYTTDAATTDAVVVALKVPKNLHSEITYPIVRLSDRDDVRQFYDFIRGQEAAAIFEKHGFQSMVLP